MSSGRDIDPDFYLSLDDAEDADSESSRPSEKGTLAKANPPTPVSYKDELREILRKTRYDAVSDSTGSDYPYEECTLDQALDAILALNRAMKPEKPIYPKVMEYVEMIEKAEKNNKYDDMYDNGFRQGVDAYEARLTEKPTIDSPSEENRRANSKT